MYLRRQIFYQNAFLFYDFKWGRFDFPILLKKRFVLANRRDGIEGFEAVEIVGGEEEGISALPKPEQGHRPHQDGRLLRRVDGNPRQQQVAIDLKH